MSEDTGTNVLSNVIRTPLHLVSAFGFATRLMLGQVAVDAKPSEIIAVPKLLEMLSLKGRIVTLHAMGCQRTIARAVVDRGGMCWR